MDLQDSGIEIIVVKYPTSDNRENGVNGVQIGLPARTYREVQKRIALTESGTYLSYFDQDGNKINFNEVQRLFGLTSIP